MTNVSEEGLQSRRNTDYPKPRAARNTYYSKAKMHCGLAEHLPVEYQGNPARKQGKPTWRIPKSSSTPKKVPDPGMISPGTYNSVLDDDDSFYNMFDC